MSNQKFYFLRIFMAVVMKITGIAATSTIPAILITVWESSKSTKREINIVNEAIEPATRLAAQSKVSFFSLIFIFLSKFIR